MRQKKEIGGRPADFVVQSDFYSRNGGLRGAILPPVRKSHSFTGCSSEPAPVVAAPQPVPAVPVSVPAPQPTPVPSPGPFAAPSGEERPRKKPSVFRWVAVVVLFCLMGGALVGVGFEIDQQIHPYDVALEKCMELRYGGEYSRYTCAFFLPDDYWEEISDFHSEIDEELNGAREHHLYEIPAEIYGNNTEYTYQIARKAPLTEAEEDEIFDRLDDEYDLKADRGYQVTVAIALSGSKGSKVILDSLIFLEDGDGWFHFDGHDFLPRFLKRETTADFCDENKKAKGETFYEVEQNSGTASGDRHGYDHAGCLRRKRR